MALLFWINLRLEASVTSYESETRCPSSRSAPGEKAGVYEAWLPLKISIFTRKIPQVEEGEMSEIFVRVS